MNIKFCVRVFYLKDYCNKKNNGKWQTENAKCGKPFILELRRSFKNFISTQIFKRRSVSHFNSASITVLALWSCRAYKILLPSGETLSPG